MLEGKSVTSAALSVSDAILSRHSCRSFTAQPVADAMLRRLLETARFAPSGGNLQPWMVHVLSDASMARFRAQLTPKFLANPLGGSAEYHVYPPDLTEPYRSRRHKNGEDLYRLIGIPREDKAARHRQFAQNYNFFGAPVAMFFFLDRIMGPPQWSDLGMLIQNIMLLAREQGLETCPQESWAIWHKEVGEFLGVDPALMLFCGLALGYGDHAAPINHLRTDRAAFGEFAVFHD
ncbi:MAG TPA: nitroreductase [Steroidobacteraceae bacterium]|nr:nitroreductase [Steroidobacteraceae bacterium]